jgi:hypothetical protein
MVTIAMLLLWFGQNKSATVQTLMHLIIVGMDER